MSTDTAENSKIEGVDPTFNALRVFPPELDYPIIQLNDDTFYDRIGCPHLLHKYKRIETMNYKMAVMRTCMIGGESGVASFEEHEGC